MLGVRWWVRWLEKGVGMRGMRIVVPRSVIRVPNNSVEERNSAVVDSTLATLTSVSDTAETTQLDISCTT